MSGWEGGYEIGVGWVVALTKRPLERRDCTPRHVLLLGRRPGPLFFWSGKMGCGCALSAMVGRLLCKCGLRLFLLNTAAVVRRVVSPAVKALGLFLCGRANTGELGAPTRDPTGA